MQEETLHINTESSMRQLIHNIVEVYRKHKTSRDCKTALTSEFLTLFLKVRVVWMVRVVLVVRVRQGPRLTLGSQTGEGTPKKVVF